MPYVALLVVVLCSAAISIATRSDGAALSVVLLLTVAHLATLGCALKRWSRWQLALAMGLLAALALPATPFQEDDYFRYWWDGLQTLTVGSPYDSAPADFYGDSQLSAAQHTALDGVNYPDTPTIYAPGLQALFAIAVAIGGPSYWPMRLLLALLHESR